MFLYIFIIIVLSPVSLGYHNIGHISTANAQLTSMHTNLLRSAVSVLLCVQLSLLVPSMAQEANATSSNVNCQMYSPSCAHLCPAKCPTKNITLTIQV